MSLIITGDDIALPVTLKKKGVTFTISGTAKIKGTLVSLDREIVLSAIIDVDKTATGTDLTKSLIIFEMTQAESLAILATGDCYLEIQVEDPLTESWTEIEVEVRKGNIL